MNQSLITSLTLPQNTTSSQYVGAIADLLGIDVTIGTGIPDSQCIAIIDGRDFDQYHEQLQANQSLILVYDINHSTILSQQLTIGEQTSQSTEILSTHPEFTDVLTGLTFRHTRQQSVFSSSGDFDPLIVSDGSPTLLRQGNIFVSATSTITDINQSAPRGCDPYRSFFDTLIPFILFIKWAFGKQCWHLSHYNACITIDDPLLQPRYGFIQFDKFVNWLNHNDLAATFAFIPWNYKRSHQRIVKLFRDNPHRLSICIHGCDHTRHEFGSTHSNHLTALSATAIHRMQAHQQRYGLTYDPIMIFPQGRFSNASLTVLARTGYSAAVNNTFFSVDYQGTLSLRDMLRSAFSRSNQVPLYQRHYPVHLFDFACDLLFEKPLIITQHHNDFADGFDYLETFTKQLNQLKPQLKWVPLGKLIEQCRWEKVGTNQQQESAQLNTVSQDHSIVDTKHYLRYSAQERAKVAIRRYLSEFRDNVIHRSPILNRVVDIIRN